MSDWHVLVVEDDPDGQEVVTRILRHHRITADVAGTAEDALKKLSATHYDLAVIDLALPTMNGWALLQAIKASSTLSGLPCVAVTAFHSAEVAVEAIQAGFAAYFPKPLEATSFVRELQRIGA
ncbi:MAG: response regulator [Chloroflexi bacterium]|nr:response regulator [Chloroflexota bacterium]